MHTKRSLLLFVGLLLAARHVYGGNGDLIVNGQVGVGTTTPSSSAAVDVSSTTKGFLPPRMTAAERDAIAAPNAGLLIFNATDNVYNFFDGLSWKNIGGSAGGSGEFQPNIGGSTKFSGWREVAVAKVYISPDMPMRLPIHGYLHRAQNEYGSSVKVRFRIGSTYTETPDPSTTSTQWVSVTNYFTDISPWYGQYVELYLQLYSGTGCDAGDSVSYGTSVSLPALTGLCYYF